MNTIFIVLPILTILMFDLGLTLKPQDFKLIAQRPKPVLVGLVGQIILLPLIAWGIIHLTLYTSFEIEDFNEFHLWICHNNRIAGKSSSKATQTKSQFPTLCLFRNIMADI